MIQRYGLMNLSTWISMQAGEFETLQLAMLETPAVLRLPPMREEIAIGHGLKITASAKLDPRRVRLRKVSGRFATHRLDALGLARPNRWELCVS